MSELPQGPSREEDAAKKAQEEQMQRELMATLLDTNARERCMFATWAVPPPLISLSLPLMPWLAGSVAYSTCQS
jgi:hypothetical protein